MLIPIFLWMLTAATMVFIGQAQTMAQEDKHRFCIEHGYSSTREKDGTLGRGPMVRCRNSVRVLGSSTTRLSIGVLSRAPHLGCKNVAAQSAAPGP